jgi:transcriptional regulator with XRE-family HTH domain
LVKKREIAVEHIFFGVYSGIQAHELTIFQEDTKLAKVPNPVDVHVGGRVRLRRTLLGLTQTVLGDSVGLTFQQIQKYERGANRIGAGRLYDFSRVLDVPVSFFYDDMSEEVSKAGPSSSSVGNVTFEQEYMARNETLKMVRAYYGIGNASVRSGIYELARSLGNKEDEDAS